MSDGQNPDGTEQKTETLTRAAEQVSGSADKVVEQLASLQRELHEATQRANEDIDAAKKKAAADVAAERRDRRYANYKFALVVVLDIVLSLVSISLYYSQVQTNNRLQTSLRQNYLTSQQQAEIRTKVLCPLYTVLLTAASSPNPEVTQTPVEKARIATALATIQAGYVTLRCTPALPKLPSPPG